jgi:hypothetical protein
MKINTHRSSPRDGSNGSMMPILPCQFSKEKENVQCRKSHVLDAIAPGG